jgi:adenylate cyclase
MRLIGDDEAELWSEHYDQVAGETLAAQEALARSIAATTVGRIMGLAVEQARAKEPEHMLPFEALALGIDLLGRYAAEANFNARLLFGRVLVHDPTSARASAGLASTLIYEWIIRPDPALLERAYDQARTALALDGADAWCHMIVGRVHLMARRFELAEHFYARAAALNPCDTDILASYGLALAYLGRPDEGIGLILRARAMNRYVPAWHDENLGFAHFVARRYPEAIAAFDRMDDAPSWVFLARSAAQYHAGDRPAARAAVTQALILDPTERVSVYAATEPFLRQEDMDHLLAGLRGAGLPD